MVAAVDGCCCRKDQTDPTLPSHHAVAVVDGHHELLEEPASLVFAQAALARGHVVEEITARAVLQNQHQVSGGQEHLRWGRASASAWERQVAAAWPPRPRRPPGRDLGGGSG